MPRTVTEDISDIFTPEGIQRIKKDQVLMFEYEGERVELKITKVNKKSGKVFAKRIKTYHPDEVEVTSKGSTEAFNDYVEGKL
jgi:hypothetical protein